MRTLPLLALLAACSVENDVVDRFNTDVWYQGTSNQSDILFVVDDSASMSEEQAALALGFSAFVVEMTSMDTDFHLGLITTGMDADDPDRGVLLGDPPYLTPADDYVQAFRARAEVGIGGSDKEKGLAAAVHALSPELLAGPNAGFLRPEALLQVVIVSDEEDCSDDGALDGFPPEDCYAERDQLLDVNVLVSELAAIKGDLDLVQVGAIVGQKGCADAWPGKRYVEAAELTRGAVGDICESDWSELLYTFGVEAASFRSAFRTSHAVDPETLEVHVDGELIEESPFRGWTWDPETWYVTFASAAIPEPGAEITASYTIAPGSIEEP